MAKFLRIAQWKAKGLAQHKGEVQLNLQQNKIDILLVRETHFTTKPTSPQTETETKMVN
jgi:hypothetical protein